MSEYEKAAIIGSPAPTGKKQPLQTIPVNIITQKYEYLNINLFDCVKNALDIKYVIGYYGMYFNDKCFMLCPFHLESAPSFKIYDDNFYCFGCGENGTVIDFMMKYFKLTNIEAVTKLNDDFKLHLPIGRSMGAATRRSLRDDKKLVENFAEWEKRAFRTLSSYFKILRFYGEQIYINRVEYFNKYLDEVENILFVETLLDLMIENMRDFSAQAAFYRDFGEAVKWFEYKLNA